MPVKEFETKAGEEGENNREKVFMERPVLLNGDFEEGKLGWENPYAIQKEENGNHYIINNHSWRIKQDLDLLPETTYEIKASSKKGTAEGPARIVFIFRDINGKKLSQYYNIKYMHKGDGWEEIPRQFIVIPENAAEARICLLTNDPDGYHCFDDIEINRVEDVGARELQGEHGDSGVLVNGDFELGLYGWIGLASLIKEEENNRFLRNGYNWEVFQQFEVVPGEKYVVSAVTRKVNSDKKARIKIVFMDPQGQRIPEFYNILHTHKTEKWENIKEIIQIPEGVQKARIFLLAEDPHGNGMCDFDNLTVIPASDDDINNAGDNNTLSIHGYQEDHLKYVVEKGDTVSGIARQFNANEQKIIDENNISNPNSLEVGQILYIPVE